MCGIAGIYNYNRNSKIDENLLIKMRDEMTHRGPDDFGLWLSDDGFTGLAHRRLSIIDLSKLARQPMCNEDETIWIVFNGEIYNHLEIRKELKEKGHLFKTDHSDTEVIIHSFEEWGINCIEKFRGMFAFAIWDESKKELWLVRDRIGIKPLYYTKYKGSIIFASEIKSIIADKTIPRVVNEEAFYHYLSFLTTPAPSTMFKGIYKLPSGCYLKVARTGDINMVRYWDVFDNTEPLVNISEDEIASKLLEYLKTSVAYRCISDVPVGIFLSGGIDSSINAALFSMLNKDNVNTFTIGYEGENKSYRNEFNYARLMAEKINAKYHEKILSTTDLINFMNDLIFYQDEPIADPVCFPIYHVSKLARDNGVIVCQVGEGSDELFMGYPGWLTALKLYGLNQMPMTTFLKKIMLLLLKSIGRQNTYSYEWLRRGLYNEPIFWGGAEAFFEAEKKLVISDRLKKDFYNFSSLECLKPILERFNQKAWNKTPLNWMSYLDINFRLPELLLMRVDKMSMAVSLEARVPFLDHKFVEFAMSIPDSVKTKNGELKHILKSSVKGLIPDELIYRTKQGFGVPMHDWFYKEFGQFAKNKITGFIKNTDFFDKNYINNLFSVENSQKMWYILNFALWYEKWISS